MTLRASKCFPEKVTFNLEPKAGVGKQRSRPREFQRKPRDGWMLCTLEHFRHKTQRYVSIIVIICILYKYVYIYPALFTYHYLKAFSDIRIVNTHAPNTGAPKYIKSLITNIKELIQ